MKYRYKINDVVTTPINWGKEVYVYKKKTDADVTFYKDLDTEFSFKYDAGFDFIDARTNNLCVEFTFTIDVLCEGSYVPYWKGLISMMECVFDDYACIVKLKPRPVEIIITDVEVNILEITTKVFTPASGPFPQVDGIKAGGRNYTQAKFLEDVVLFCAQQPNPQINGVISDFFQWNPINVSTEILPGISNKFYAGDALCVCALSDVQEPVPSDLAEIEFVKFQDLMNDLNVIFNVYWFVDENNYIRIEHDTYFKALNGFDITIDKYDKYFVGKQKFSYLIEEMPHKEFWRPTSSDSYVSLTYEGCGYIAKNTNEKNYTCRLIVTDYYNIRYKIPTGGGSDNGLFLFATDGGGFNGYEMITSESGQNKALTPIKWVSIFHRYGRPQPIAEFKYFDTEENKIVVPNQGEFLNYSIRPNLLREDITIPFCCTDNLDTTKALVTPYGNGFLRDGRYNIKNQTLNLALMFKTINDNQDIIPTDLPGLQLWLKADEGVSLDINGKVQQWDDFSGNNRHATQSNSAKRPDHTPGGAIVFGNNLENLTTPSFPLFPNKRGTIFILFLSGGGASLPSDDMIFSTNNSAPGGNFFDFAVRYTAPNDEFYSVNLGAALPSFSYTYNLYSMTRASDDTIKFIQNGLIPTTNYPVNTVALNNDGTYGIPNTQITPAPFQIGVNIDPVTSAYGSEVNLYEIIIYDRALTDIERQKIELYISKKAFTLWNISEYLQ